MVKEKQEGFKEADWGEIACQGLWNPQADWAESEPTIKVQSPVSKPDRSLSVFEEVSFSLSGGLDSDNQQIDTDKHVEIPSNPFGLLLSCMGMWEDFAGEKDEQRVRLITLTCTFKKKHIY